MTMQEQIIALLQGDLKGEAQIAELLKQVADSPEQCRALIDHIDLNLRVDQYVGELFPSSIETDGVWQQIAAYENSRTGAVPIQNKSLPKILIGVLLGLIAGLGVGYWLSNDSADVIAEHVAQGADTLPARSEIPSPAHDADSGVSSPGVMFSGPKESMGSLNLPPDAFPPRRPVAEGGRSLHVVTPNGGEVYKAGSTIPIVWEGRYADGQSVVEYSLDGGSSWLEVAPHLGVNHSLLKLPDAGIASSECLVRLSVENPDVLQPTLAYTFLGHDSGTGVSVAEISPDGTVLATVGKDEKVILWDLQTGQQIHLLDGHTSYVTFARFNQDGTRFASCSQDGSVQIWNVETGEQELFLLAEGEGGMVPWAAAFDPVRPEIAVCNDDGSITFWDSKDGTKSARFEETDARIQPHEEAIRYLEYSKDGKYLIASSSDKTGSLIDAETGAVVLRFEHHIPDTSEVQSAEEFRNRMRIKVVNGIQRTPDGKIVITCGYDGLVKYWDGRNGKLLRTMTYHGGDKVSSIQLSPDGKQFVSVGYDGTSKIIDVATGKILSTITLGENSPMLRASFSSDMRRIAIAHGNAKATLWKLHPMKHNDVSDAPWSIEPCMD